MGSWFSRWFGRKDVPAAAPESTSAKPASMVKPAEKPTEPMTREELLEALQLKLPEKPPAPIDPALIAQVLEAFRKGEQVPSSPPTLAMRILNLISLPDPDPNELAKMVQLEPALTAGVLRVANSATTQGVERIGSLREAITRLGTVEVASICAALSTKSVFGPGRRAEEAKYGAAFAELFVHATATALASASLAFSMPKTKSRSDVVFLSALLHDIGMSVALSVYATLHAAGAPGLTREQIQQLLDAVHVEIGAVIHREWKLPDAALQICEHHHGGEAPEAANELQLVKLTSALQLLHNFPSESRLDEIRDSAFALGLNKQALRAFDGDVRRFTGTAKSIGG